MFLAIDVMIQPMLGQMARPNGVYPGHATGQAGPALLPSHISEIIRYIL